MIFGFSLCTAPLLVTYFRCELGDLSGSELSKSSKVYILLPILK